MKHILFRHSVLIAVATLFSCASEDEQASIRLLPPDQNRQISAVDDSQLTVEIKVNDGDIQRIDLGEQNSVSITGIRSGERNDISIKWIETVDLREVEISLQEQSFVAEGNATIIDAQHMYSIFDYDNDSISNFDERLQGTCVWSGSIVCDGTISLENNAENLFLNGDFTQANTYWWSLGDDPDATNGEYCVTSLPLPTDQTFLGYIPTLSFSTNTQYSLSFDVRANIDSTVVARFTNPQFLDLLQEDVSVTTTYTRKTIPFSFAITLENLSFTVAPPTGHPSVRYCIDNVALVPVAQF